ncbi:MAG: hypothetical protein ABSC47_08450, partial [Terracidiphilus sp.]
FVLIIPVRDSATIRVIPDYYTHTLGFPIYIRYDDSLFHTAPITWSSWTSYYGASLSRLYSQSADFIQNYRERLALIRRTISPDRFIELCPTGVPLNAVILYDSPSCLQLHFN